MPDFFVPILFGWPAVIASLAVSTAGLLWKRPVLLLLGALLAAPFAYYLFGTPRFRYLGPLLPLFQVVAAYALHRKLTWLAWLYLLPLAAAAALLAWTVLNQ
jgi:hypothetical protein